MKLIVSVASLNRVEFVQMTNQTLTKKLTLKVSLKRKILTFFGLAPPYLASITITELEAEERERP